MALRVQALSLFEHALVQSRVRDRVTASITQDETFISFGDRSMRRADIDRIFIIAMGKASLTMYEAVREVFSIGLPVPFTVLVVSPHNPAQPAVGASHETFLTGGHPIPNGNSFYAADRILSTLSGVSARDAVLFLVSGGGSAMVERPLDASISLQDTAAFYRTLVGSGLSITEMNILRKHCSAVKGGRLAVAAAQA